MSKVDGPGATNHGGLIFGPGIEQGTGQVASGGGDGRGSRSDSSALGEALAEARADLDAAAAKGRSRRVRGGGGRHIAHNSAGFDGVYADGMGGE